MSTSIGLVSGKGGTGKTTFALLLGDILSQMQFSTLIVDCDLATNGATYFFEDRLSDSDCALTSNKVLHYASGSSELEESFVSINPYLHFMPSVTANFFISERSEWEKYAIPTNVCDFFKDIREKYDFIIYDMQAGYSDILGLLSDVIDTFFFLSEPNAISASSLRVLFLKIGDRIAKKKCYQIINKASEEEQKIFSNLTSGTLFPIVGVVRYETEIRKAFSLARLPDFSKCDYSVLFTFFDIIYQVADRNQDIINNIHDFENKITRAIYHQASLEMRYYEKKRRRKDCFRMYLVSVLMLLMSVVIGLGFARLMPLSFPDDLVKIIPYLGLILFILIVGVINLSIISSRDMDSKALEEELEYLTMKKSIKLLEKRVR